MSRTSTARRSDVPVRLGHGHGYRIELDEVVLHAELDLPPYLGTPTWALELWAKDAPSPVPEDGHKVAEVVLDLPTPLVPQVHTLDVRRPAHLPPAGDYTMTLVLVELRDQGTRVVHESFDYPRREVFSGPRLDGAIGYARDGDAVVLTTDAVVNPRAWGNVSGSLRLTLCAIAHDASDDDRTHELATVDLGAIEGQHGVASVRRSAPWSEPPAGRWTLELRLQEWTSAFGFVTRDRRRFDQPYERPSTSVAAVEGAAVEGAAVEGAAVEGAAVEGAAVEAAVTAAPNASALPQDAAVVSKTSGVSISTATAKELGKIKGITSTLAKDIIAARPFKTLDDLLRVPGIGKRTLQKLRSHLRL